MCTEIFKCVAGSHLFGTSTKDSDTDFKAVHIPSARDILLGRTQGVKDTSTGNGQTANTSEDVDSVSFPIQKFMGMLAKGETNAIEMLHAPNMHDDWIWDTLVENKFRLIPANMKAFVVFGHSQAIRYAVRGDRVTSLQKLVDVLESFNPGYRVAMGPDAFMRLREIPNVKCITKKHGDKEVPYLVAFGREAPMHSKAGEVAKIFRKPLNEAGKRSRDAVDGPDWKGLYHAHRIVDEGIELFSTGNLVFPCKNAPEYLQIRRGELKIDAVLDRFDEKLAILEGITPISDFRGKADTVWIDEFVMSIHEQYVVNAYHEWAQTT